MNFMEIYLHQYERPFSHHHFSVFNFETLEFSRSVRLKSLFSIEISRWDMDKCPSYRGVCLTFVRLMEVFL